jgi:hypothetical protein
VTYGSDKILWRGVYGYVQQVSLKSWNAANKRAREEYYKQIAQQESPKKKPKNHNHYWTKRQVSYLRNKRKEGVPFAKIAAHLKRSESACNRKAQELGIANKRRTNHGTRT